jgi:hypothetical protein
MTAALEGDTNVSRGNVFASTNDGTEEDCVGP